MAYEVTAKPNGVIYTIGAEGYVRVKAGQRLKLAHLSEVEIIVYEGETLAIVKGAAATFSLENQ